ncbi:MAG: hypothetical protein OHK0017_13220 [Patescibacteria group bacterium]
MTVEFKPGTRNKSENQLTHREISEVVRIFKLALDSSIIKSAYNQTTILDLATLKNERLKLVFSEEFWSQKARIYVPKQSKQLASFSDFSNISSTETIYRINYDDPATQILSEVQKETKEMQQMLAGLRFWTWEELGECMQKIFVLTALNYSAVYLINDDDYKWYVQDTSDRRRQLAKHQYAAAQTPRLIPQFINYKNEILRQEAIDWETLATVRQEAKKFALSYLDLLIELIQKN